jgi:hypothetical protein
MTVSELWNGKDVEGNGNLIWYLPGVEAGIATGYGLNDRGVGIRVPVGCSLLHVVQTGSRAHPNSYPKGTGGSFPGVKQPGREADHSLPASGEVKKIWIYTSTPHMPSWRSA